MLDAKIIDEIQSSVLKLFKVHLKTDEISLEKPSSGKNGDLSTNIAFRLAGQLKKNPAEVADLLATDLAGLAYFKNVDAVGGFVNFFLAPETFQQNLAEILSEGEKYGQNDLFAGQKIQVEFISANPTGPLTIAIGRGGFGGDALSNLFTWSGATVTREYYVNDGGNQVKILGDSILIAAGIKKPEGDFYRGEYLENWAKKHKKEIEKLKDDSFALGSVCVPYILDEYIKPALTKMKIKFDNFYSEKSLYENKLVERSLEHLKNEKLTYKKDDATWLQTSKFGDDKDRVIVKSSGEYTYVLPDIAYHWEKFDERKFDQVIDILGADHHGYTDRMLAAIAALGYESKIKYLLTQLVKLVKDGKEYKMSKRKGIVVTIDDLFDLIGEDASDVARYFFLSRSFNTHMDFDLDLARERSEKNPVFYVKYAHARIHGILANAKIQITNNKKADLGLIKAPEEMDLIDKLSELPLLIQSILTAGDYPVHQLTFYAQEVAKKFHQFYDKCRVIDEENPELTAARLELVRATQLVLKIVGEKLIGIKMPERM